MLALPRVRVIAALVLIGLAALGLRALWILNTDTVPPFLSDPQYYHVTATNIAEGRGYAVRTGPLGFESGPGSEATAFWAPGYSFTLAAFYRVFGADQAVAKAVNALAGALLVMPCYYIGRRLARVSGAPAATARASGLAAAVFAAALPASIYWTPALFSEPLFTLAIAATLAAAVFAGERGHTSLPALLLVGALLAAAVMIRSQAVVLILPIALLLVPSRDPARAARVLAAIVLPVVLAVAPWAFRNEAAMGRPFLVSDNVCYNLRASHAPYSTGTTVAPEDLWAESPGITFKERELLFDDLGCGRAWDYARSHPRREAELAVKKVGWLLRSDAAPAIRWSTSLYTTPIHRGDAGAFVLLGDIAWYPLVVLTVASLALLPSSRPKWALWSFIAAWFAMHLVFHGEPRYHVPLTPAMFALAAAALAVLPARIRGLRTREPDL